MGNLFMIQVGIQKRMSLRHLSILIMIGVGCIKRKLIYQKAQKQNKTQCTIQQVVAI